ncbi:MAG: pyrroline-5-carboxylate reductase [Lachnospiraceae bacterium]|nr:pyrroline-5-carboxylate reductase [Lachnospiraceae bacterium]
MKIGFIGCGNMGKAIMAGILAKGLASKDEIIASDVSEAARNACNEQYGVNITDDNRTVVKESDIVFLAVKPTYYEDVITDIRKTVSEVLSQREGLSPGLMFISIAPGKTISWLDKNIGDERIKIVRTMPNTPALVGEGITGVAFGKNLDHEDKELALKLLNSFGKAEVVKENLMDVVTSVSGSSPAYVFMFIEAMADAAVADGMPRAQAYTFAAQAVLGSAKMVLETGKHPGELKDMVCSPGGTTIEAVRVLEAKGMRSAVFEAMKACTKKSRES